MSAYNKEDVEASAKPDNNSNKKTKVNDTRGGSNVRSWIWLYFDPMFVEGVRHADAKKTSTYLRHVIADVPTRWNSSYLAWCRLLELEKYIRVLEVELAKDTSPDSKKDSQHLTKIMLTKDEWDLLRDLIPVLGPFEEATRYLGGSKYVTYSTMNPIMIHIINILKPTPALSEELNVETIKDIFTELEICDDENDSPKRIDLDKPIQTVGILEKVKKTLYRAMRYYWKKDNNESYLPSIIDPRVKRFDFAPDKIKPVQDLLRVRYHDMKDNLSTANLTSTTNISLPTSYFHNTTVSPFYKPTLLNIFNNSSPLNSQNEPDEYLAVPQIPFGSDPFAWWNMNKDRFPTLSKLARIYLAVSATSTPSERLFSDC
ncbi:4288_t:CDS:2, partial [Racocetra persica]